MPSGLFCQIKVFPDCLGNFSMCLTVGYCFSAFHGQKELLSGRYALCTRSTYVTMKYGNAIVVFDSYRGKSTKDMTHQRRTKGQTGAMVTFTENMHLTMRKDQFLANKENKQRFIDMLSMKLVERSCKTYHASGYADLLIVQKLNQLQQLTLCWLVMILSC